MKEPRYTVSAEELNDEIMRRRYCELLSHPECFPSEDNWRYIISKQMGGLGAGLYRKYLVAWLTDEDIRTELHEAALKYFPEYLRTVDRQYAISVVYGDTESSPVAFRELVYQCQLFDAESIGNLVDRGDLELAADLLGALQPEYDGDAVDAMRYLLNRFDKLPNLGEITTKHGLFRNEQVYICPDGHVNPVEVTYCRHENCGKDIKGLDEGCRGLIEELRSRIAVLTDMLA